MTERPSPPDTDGDVGVGPDRGSTTGARSYPGAPRWVKVSGIVALVLVLLIVIAMFVGGGNHGPGRHIPSGGAGGDTSAIVSRGQPR